MRAFGQAGGSRLEIRLVIQQRSIVQPVRLILAVLLALACAFVGFGVSLSYFRTQEQLQANGRLSLYRSSLTAETERFSHLTYVLARDPLVIAVARGKSASGPLNQRLADFAQQAGLDAIYLMRPDGETISASNADLPESFIGHNYAFRPYFQEAAAGVQGRFYGIGSTTGLPGYFLADPVLNSRGDIVGVLALKLDLSRLEIRWREAGEQVILANQDGVVLLASQPDWRYRTLAPLSAEQRAKVDASRQFADQPLTQLDWQPLANQRARIAGGTRMHLMARDLPQGWVLHYFASEDRALVRAWLVAGAVALLGAILLVLTQLRRTRQIGAALKRSEAEEAQLRLANERLAVEIDERRAAERRLKRTKDELERASRLAALGQLAASVTHELGQPIAAMRNHLAAAELGGSMERALPRLSGLVDRMEGITRQLKFFARTEAEEFGEVDLCQAMAAARDLLLPTVAVSDVQFHFNKPEQPILVRGNQLRLEQVMTNLLRNAFDAVEHSDRPTITATLGQTAFMGWFEISDNGHGLGAATLADLQEPFVTTRESGRGMGLGLAISAGIIKEHEGTLHACNLPESGALFRVEIPLLNGEGRHE